LLYLERSKFVKTKENPMPLFNRTLALALGGGGGRGLLYTGFLQTLDSNKLKPDLITGTSIGALVGALYASGATPVQKMNEVIKQVLSSKDFTALGLPSQKGKKTVLNRVAADISILLFYQKLFRTPYLIPGESFRKILRSVLPDCKIEDLPIRFAAVAFDAKTKTRIIFSKGPLIEAVQASAAIPGIMEPVSFNGMTCMDGGWMELVPVNAARELGAGYVIACDIRAPSDILSADKGFDILRRADHILSDQITDSELSRADLVIKMNPPNAWYDFSDPDRMSAFGSKCANENLSKIRKIFRRKKSLFGT
jgi:NTE family protein